ncbi:hypothetical protein EV193_103226 [Herbihabitans rhizosphaerae]|uniref:Uncharacterized protein n=1 Tax=Herbihabitans rhizosphaerae TaxID=1872711 RepID=A0A4Q7KY26_9PSEU|nr:hypothetical protein [Herbihabitans rhizosphaerae]RZS40911.1 hypothetical protein EV193_103226 [Herbihabitans rhizosphaerae]
MYTLAAFLTRTPETLRQLGGELPVVRLPQECLMVPFVRAVRDLVQDRAEAHPDLDDLTAGWAALAERASAAGAIAFCQADFFGGTGGQSSIVWRDGAVVLGPVHTFLGDGDNPPASAWPINAALAELGVVAGGLDAFDTVRLGGRRRTERWLEHAEPSRPNGSA